MPKRKTRRERPAGKLYGLYWQRFSAQKSTNLRNICDLLEKNLVSCSVTGPCTHRDVVEAIAKAAHIRISIESLPDILSLDTLPRGWGCFGYVGDELDEIAMNYPNMLWWISEKGLSMAIVPPEAAQLSPFDELAGSLTSINWREGNLPKEGLWEIAQALDEATFSLKDALQPAQWKVIAQHNQKWPKKAIKTFEQAARSSRFTCFVRRRLYIARQKFDKAHSVVL